MTTPRRSGLSSIGFYSYRRASGAHGSASFHTNESNIDRPHNRSITIKSKRRLRSSQFHSPCTIQYGAKFGPLSGIEQLFPSRLRLSPRDRSVRATRFAGRLARPEFGESTQDCGAVNVSVRIIEVYGKQGEWPPDRAGGPGSLGGSIPFLFHCSRCSRSDEKSVLRHAIASLFISR
jgi:hypothetical protein